MFINYALSVFLLFFSRLCFVYHRDLHSFPTRRSSDLGTDTIQSNITWTLATSGQVENLTLTGSAIIDATGNGLNNVLTGNSDRKSTRLNSSHLVISYAVFCLKKKTLNETTIKLVD